MDIGNPALTDPPRLLRRRLRIFCVANKRGVWFSGLRLSGPDRTTKGGPEYEEHKKGDDEKYTESRSTSVLPTRERQECRHKVLFVPLSTPLPDS